jgi:hypothetical protein
MTHPNDASDNSEDDLRQVRLALAVEDHRRLRVLAAQLDRTYSEVVALGLAALAQQRGALRIWEAPRGDSRIAPETLTIVDEAEHPEEHSAE